jgi:hypothetical protein
MEKHTHIFIYKALGERKEIGATANKYFTRRGNSECFSSSSAAFGVNSSKP